MSKIARWLQQSAVTFYVVILISTLGHYGMFDWQLWAIGVPYALLLAAHDFAMEPTK